MPPNDPKKREALLETVKKLAEPPAIPMGSLGEGYELFKQIEADLRAAEDDPELYNALMLVRTRLKEAMEVRARELGKSDEWAEAMKEHDMMLLLRPLFRAQNDPQEYINTYCRLSAEQKAALDYLGKKTGIHLPRPEVFEAELRWNNIRRGSILRLIPDPELNHTWFERLKAILLVLLLALGLAFAIGNSSWTAATVVLALLVVVAGTWTRDFATFIRKRRQAVEVRR
jgi:hypothetical protein